MECREGLDEGHLHTHHRNEISLATVTAGVLVATDGTVHTHNGGTHTTIPPSWSQENARVMEGGCKQKKIRCTLARVHKHIQMTAPPQGRGQGRGIFDLDHEN